MRKKILIIGITLLFIGNIFTGITDKITSKNKTILLEQQICSSDSDFDQKIKFFQNGEMFYREI